MPSIFEKNLGFLSRFDAAKALTLASVPLCFAGERQKQKSEWQESLRLQETMTFFVYGIGVLGEEYFAIKKWLQQNSMRTAVFLVDDWPAARCFLETSVASELLTNPQVIFKLFTWPKEEVWGTFRAEFEWFFQTFSGGKIAFAAKFGACPEEQERAGLLNRQFQRNIDDWIRTYYNYLVGQKDVFDSYYLNLLELPNAAFGQLLEGCFSSIPAIICGAGPSLSKNIDKLRHLQDKAILFGSGSGLNILSRQGIIPHFAAGVDPTSTQESRLSTNFAFQVPFFYMNRFNHAALKQVHGDKLFMRGGARLKAVDWFEQQLGLAVGSRVHPGMSTSNFCAEVAGILGCNPIILVGMDLCYKEDNRYAPGVTAHPAESQKHHQEIVKKKATRVETKDIQGHEVITSWDWLLESECFSNLSTSYPLATVLNATEGGMPIHGIPNISLQEAIDTYMQRTWNLEPLIHGAIQKASVGFTSRESIKNALINWLRSLELCENTLQSHQKYLEKKRDSQQTEGDDSSVSFLAPTLEELLGNTSAYAFCLEQYNQVFNSLNGKEFFRMVHYPEALPPSKAAEMSLLIEGERCKFCLEKLAFHKERTEEALSRLPAYPKIPSSSLKREGRPLFSEEQRGDFEKIHRFFYLTGELYAIKRYSRNALEGKQEFFYVDGCTKTILHYHKGLLHGDVFLFYPLGKPKRSLHFARGQLDGFERWWNEEGMLSKEVQYLENEPVGIACSWHNNGVLARKITYRQGVAESVLEWDSEGLPL